MTANLKPYPEYKPTGLPWLGDVPKHWDMVRMKHLFNERNVRGYPDEPLLAATQAKGVVRKEDYENRTVLALKDLHLLKLVRLDDFVISLRSFQGGIEYARHQGIISPAYTILYPDDPQTHGYLAVLLKSKAFIDGLRLYVTGIRQGQNIDYVKLSRSPLPVPPPEEQKDIATFVKDLSRRIARFVRNRRRLVAVLGEQKQAIINQAVTQGLDPNAPKKPSGIDWLGDIPEHWEVTPLRHVATVQTGITLGKNYGSQQLEQRPYLRVANVQTGRADLREVKTIAVPPSAIAGSELQEGDVLMTEGGDIDKLGRGCVWHAEVDGCLHQNHVFAVRVDQERLLPEYLVAMMASRHGRAYFELTAKRTTNLASTNSSKVRRFPILLAPLADQREILNALVEDTRAIDAPLDRAEREIALIHEYRTRLISDVVTGKVDVRGLAAGLDEGALSAEAEEYLGEAEEMIIDESADLADSE